MIASPFTIDGIVDSPSKLAILRVFTSRVGLKATGSEVAKMAGFSVPSTHESLKTLHDRNILIREIIGNQHIYSLNEEDRIVQKIIRPMFAVENNYKHEIGDFLLEEIKRAGIKGIIISLILYGSVAQKGPKGVGDVDVAVVVEKKKDVARVGEVFHSKIAEKFKSFFGVQLDFYVKSRREFEKLLKNHRPPVSTLMKAYSVLYGKQPLEVSP